MTGEDRRLQDSGRSSVCIGCAFLVAQGAANLYVALSPDQRKGFRDRTSSFRDVPSPLSCAQDEWTRSEFGENYVGNVLSVDIKHDYGKEAVHHSICKVDRRSQGCFVRFDPTAPTVEVALQRAQEAAHRSTAVQLSREQASLDRRLLKLTVLALMLSSVFSLASFIVSFVALVSPVQLESPVVVRVETTTTLPVAPGTSTPGQAGVPKASPGVSSTTAGP